MTTLKTVLLSLFVSTLSVTNIYGQKTPDDLGRITFHYFKSNNLDSLYRLIPSLTELSEYGKKMALTVIRHNSKSL